MNIIEAQLVQKGHSKRKIISKVKRDAYYKVARDAILKSYANEIYNGAVLPKNWLVKNKKQRSYINPKKNPFFEKKKNQMFYKKKKITLIDRIKSRGARRRRKG